MSEASLPGLRSAAPGDAVEIAEIWYQGWIDGHLGHVPQALAYARSAESSRHRTPLRVADTTMAVVDSEVVGFIVAVEDEVEQVYVSSAHRGAGIADVLLDESERLVREAGHGVAWRDAGLFDYGAADSDGENPTNSSSGEQAF